MINNKIFISYSWKNSYEARHLSNVLKVLGYETWIDYEKLNLKGELHPQIYKGIISCDYFLLILSSETLNSHWVEFEFKVAQHNLAKDKIVIVDLDSNTNIHDLNESVPKFNLNLYNIFSSELICRGA